MIYQNYKAYSYYAFFTAIIVFTAISFVEARSSAVIDENVSATANSGGNVIEGGGEIKTGNASASSSTKTTVKGGGETKFDVKTEAEANGKKVEAEVHKEKAGEDISIEKKVEKDGSEAQASIDISSHENEQADASENLPNNAEEKNIWTRVTESVSSAIKNIFGKIISIFG